MGLTLKIGSATTLLGFAGCGSMCASGCVNTVKMQLEKEGFKLISSEEGWKKKLKKYDKDFKNTSNSVNLEKSCQTILNQNPSKDNWKLAVKWCVEEQSVQEILQENYTILNTTEDKEPEWANKVEKLKQSKNKTFKNWKNKMNNGNPDGNKLKQECRNLKSSLIKTVDETFEDIFLKTKAFCAIRKPNK